MSYTPELSNSDIVYVAGPMTGHVDYNFPAFDEAEQLLKSLYGCSVVNPAQVDRAVGVHSIMDGRSQREMTEFFMDLNTATIKKCTALVLLEGWETSPGARHELAMADRLGIKVFAMLTTSTGHRKPVRVTDKTVSIFTECCRGIPADAIFRRNIATIIRNRRDVATEG